MNQSKCEYQNNNSMSVCPICGGPIPRSHAQPADEAQKCLNKAKAWAVFAWISCILSPFFSMICCTMGLSECKRAKWISPEHSGITAIKRANVIVLGIAAIAFTVLFVLACAYIYMYGLDMAY